MKKNVVLPCISIANREEQVEVDWAGDSTHIHMFEFFCVAKILAPDNCTTAVNHQRSD